MSSLDQIGISIEGHIKVFEYSETALIGSDAGIVLLNKRNAIHNEHASILIARAIRNQSNGSIYRMHFGTGGATVDPLGNIIYAEPNVVGSSDLNNPVYFEVVDNNTDAPSGNQMAVRHVSGTLFSDVEIRCVLGKNEPFGQAAFDNSAASNINTNQFVFDEIALKTQDGLLITHIVFSPIEKSRNRIVEIVYTLRIRIVE